MIHLKQLSPFFFATALSGLALLTGCEQAREVATPEAKAEAKPEAEAKPASIKKPAPVLSVSEKKAKFFAFLNPMIKQANAEVLEQRQQLLNLSEHSDALDEKQTATLAALVKTYRVKKTLTNKEKIEQLKVKVNTVPAALILAQAANESAWGTSRFATKGNNFFGQWCYKKGCGLIPNGRTSGAKHEVARFKSPLGSVKSYIRNLNSHPTYKLLRTLRQQSIQKGKAASGELLAQGLVGYSQRGEEYVKEIQSMIRYNKLSRFDSTNMSKPSKDADKG